MVDPEAVAHGVETAPDREFGFRVPAALTPHPRRTVSSRGSGMSGRRGRWAPRAPGSRRTAGGERRRRRGIRRWLWHSGPAPEASSNARPGRFPRTGASLTVQAPAARQRTTPRRASAPTGKPRRAAGISWRDQPLPQPSGNRDKRAFPTSLQRVPSSAGRGGGPTRAGTPAASRRPRWTGARWPGTPAAAAGTHTPGGEAMPSFDPLFNVGASPPAPSPGPGSPRSRRSRTPSGYLARRGTGLVREEHAARGRPGSVPPPGTPGVDAVARRNVASRRFGKPSSSHARRTTT